MPHDSERPTSTPASDLARALADPAFFIALCHDLRGPLGAIGTWLHVLGSGRADPATQQQAVAAMQRDVGCQRRLIEQLGDLSSILGGTLRPSSVDVDLVSVLDQLGAQLEVKGPSSRVLADPERLRQLLAILLAVPAPMSTAPVLVASPEGAGMLSIRGRARKEGPGLVGLTLARALAELQGGRLAISPAAEGPSFTLSLPTPGPAGQI